MHLELCRLAKVGRVRSSEQQRALAWVAGFRHPGPFVHDCRGGPMLRADGLRCWGGGLSGARVSGRCVCKLSGVELLEVVNMVSTQVAITVCVLDPTASAVTRDTDQEFRSSPFRL